MHNTTTRQIDMSDAITEVDYAHTTVRISDSSKTITITQTYPTHIPESRELDWLCPVDIFMSLQRATPLAHISMTVTHPNMENYVKLPWCDESTEDVMAEADGESNWLVAAMAGQS
jgi:hypothetical protein